MSNKIGHKRSTISHTITRTNFVFILTLFVTMASIPACASEKLTQPLDKETETAKFIKQDFDVVDELQFRPMAYELLFPNGNILIFTAKQNDYGEVIALGMSELRRAGNLGVASVPELARARVPDIFHAISKPGTKMPGFLRLARTEPVQPKPQGWARDLVVYGKAAGNVIGNPQLKCPQLDWSWETFKEDVLAKGLPLSFLSEGDGPATKPNHWKAGESLDRFRLYGRLDDVYSFYGNVLYCFADDSLEAMDYEPRVVWTYWEANSDIAIPDWKFLMKPGDEHNFLFQVPDPQTLLGKGFNISLRIEWPYVNDKFYIGAAWSKFSDTLINPQ